MFILIVYINPNNAAMQCTNGQKIPHSMQNHILGVFEQMCFDETLGLFQLYIEI